MFPAALFWAMVLVGSFHGLVAFGRSVLGSHAGWEYLVPGALNGVSALCGPPVGNVVHPRVTFERMFVYPGHQ